MPRGAASRNALWGRGLSGSVLASRGGSFLASAEAPSALSEDAGQIAARWLAEWSGGIAGTGLRPGFIKFGVDSGPLSALDRKLVQAAARAHRRCGLTLAVHTGGNPGAISDQLAILRTEGVAPQALVWIHANQCSDDAAVLAAASAGAWISLDGLAADTLDRHSALCPVLQGAGRLSQTLLSPRRQYLPGQRQAADEGLHGAVHRFPAPPQERWI